MLLSQVTSIHSGYSLRNTIPPHNKTPNVALVQPAHILAQNLPTHPTLYVKLAKNITILKEGDVLLTNRVHFKATIFHAESNIDTLASAGIWVLRPIVSYLDSTFLAFWLNSAQGQQALKGVVSKFATLHSIRKEDLANLSLPDVSLTQQKELSNLYECCIKQNALQQQRFKLQLQLLDALMAQHTGVL